MDPAGWRIVQPVPRPRNRGGRPSLWADERSKIQNHTIKCLILGPLVDLAPCRTCVGGGTANRRNYVVVVEPVAGSGRLRVSNVAPRRSLEHALCREFLRP